jgi:hypothetical protein
MGGPALFWWCLTTSHWLAVLSQLHNPFPESQSTTCCIACKNEQFSSQTLCTTWGASRSTKKLQWFIILSGPTRYSEITGVKDGTYPANHDGYSAACRECPPGWYRRSDTCLCSVCSAACPSNQYESSPCSPTTNRVCSACGTCGIGQEKSADCNGVSNIVCQSCPAGKYRDQNVVNTQTACATCLTCSTTRRERRVGCSASVNEVCPQCDAGSIVVLGATTDSCQACTSGKYAKASENTCATCTQCTRTQKRTSDCLTSADRVCEPCGNNKYNLELNSGTCTGCIEGYFNTGAGSCAVCAGSSCGDGYYRSCLFTETGGGVKLCTACQGQQEAPNCNPGYGVNARCNGQGTTMVSCELCGIGKHRPAGTDLVNNYQTCMPCETGFFKTTAGSAACSACSNKPASNAQYVTWGALLPSSNTCPW